MEATEGGFLKNMYSGLGIVLTIGLLTLSCERTTSDANRNVDKDQVLTQETTVGHIPITDEIAGSAYRKRATKYFVVAGKDTSNYRPIFIESKEGAAVRLDLRTRYSGKPRPYQELLKELEIIFLEARKDYNLDSLKGISIGRLVHTGDLAIDITRQYYATFEQKDGIPTNDYPKIADFLLKSKLGSQFNNFLNKFEMEIDKISVEKVYFTTIESVKSSPNIRSDTTSLPDKILDCMTWIKVKNR